MTLIEALRKNGSQLCDTAADALEDAKDDKGSMFAYVEELRAENARLRAALESIASYYEREFCEGEKAYQAAIVAREVLKEL